MLANAEYRIVFGGAPLDMDVHDDVGRRLHPANHPVLILSNFHLGASSGKPRYSCR